MQTYVHTLCTVYFCVYVHNFVSVIQYRIFLYKNYDWFNIDVFSSSLFRLKLVLISVEKLISGVKKVPKQWECNSLFTLGNCH